MKIQQETQSTKNKSYGFNNSFLNLQKFIGSYLDGKCEFNTPGTAGGPGGRDRTLAVKSRKTPDKSSFFRKKIKFTLKKYIFLHISSSYT